MTPETLHDALSLGMALRYHWQQTRGETISDHEPFHVHFEGDRIVVTDRAHRQYLLTFRPFQRPPDPAVSTDYCPWVIDHDPEEGEPRCGTELRATTGPRATFEASVPLDTGLCGAAVRPATVPAGERRSLLARICQGSFHDREVLRSILRQCLGVKGASRSTSSVSGDRRALAATCGDGRMWPVSWDEAGR